MTEHTHKLDTVLQSIYAVRHPLCTKEAKNVEIAAAFFKRFAMTKTLEIADVYNEMANIGIAGKVTSM